MSRCQAASDDCDSRQQPAVTAVTSWAPVWRHWWRCDLYTNTCTLSTKPSDGISTPQL